MNRVIVVILKHSSRQNQTFFEPYFHILLSILHSPHKILYPKYPPVIIHHKFIVIDAETESPIIYSGSANMGGNSVFNNDENLFEIKGSPRLARIYLAECLRLYEHYRARARFIEFR